MFVLQCFQSLLSVIYAAESNVQVHSVDVCKQKYIVSIHFITNDLNLLLSMTCRWVLT